MVAMETSFGRRMRGWGLAGALATVAVIAGCGSSSSLVNLWKAPDAPERPMRSVLVVSMQREATMRRVWEDRFVTELGKHGVDAVPSYRLFPNAPPDTDDLVRAVDSRRLDGVVAIHRLPNETDTHYVPGYTTVTPYQRYNPWTGYYHTHYVEEYNPGFTETDTIVRYEVDLWSPRQDEGLVWSGVTETINPGSTADVNREVSRLIVPEMGKSGVLAGTGRHRS